MDARYAFISLATELIVEALKQPVIFAICSCSDFFTKSSGKPC